jgi:deazaflavin-dependent oxidoreductase (nitroreductase family)
MKRAIAAFVGGMALAVTAIGAVFIVGMRRKAPPVLDAVRRMNRSVGNPRQMKSAGTPGAYASVIKHVGRTSSRPYETPVGAIPTDDGFLIALPYGSRADWLKNVLASGSATIVHEGVTHLVDHPELVATADVAPELPAKQLRTLRLFRVDQCLRVQRLPDGGPAS